MSEELQLLSSARLRHETREHHQGAEQARISGAGHLWALHSSLANALTILAHSLDSVTEKRQKLYEYSGCTTQTPVQLTDVLPLLSRHDQTQLHALLSAAQHSASPELQAQAETYLSHLTPKDAL